MYTLLYTEQNVTKYKVFETLPLLKKWAGDFVTEHLDNPEDYWLDAIFDGEPIITAIHLKSDSYRE